MPENQYKIDRYGNIASPGEFEGETILAPLLYQLSLDRGADETVYTGNSLVDIFELDEDIEDRLFKQFPELARCNGLKPGSFEFLEFLGYTPHATVCLTEDPSGFVYVISNTQE